MTLNRSAKKRHNPALQSLCNEVVDVTKVIIAQADSLGPSTENVGGLFEAIKVR